MSTKEYYAKAREAKSIKVRTAYAGAYKAANVMSDELYRSMDVVAGISFFKQPPSELLLWIRKQPPVVRDELFLFGISKAISLARYRLRGGKKSALRVYHDAAAKGKELRTKSKAFDRIVEMLDHLDVNGKVLGDCTKADLLRAAVQLETSAGEATLRAALYRQIADMVGKGTVREASNRGQIVALLTTTFKEAA